MNNLEQEINITFENKINKLYKLYDVVYQELFNFDFNRLKSGYEDFVMFKTNYDLDIIYFTNMKNVNSINVSDKLVYQNIILYLYSNNIYEKFLEYFKFIKYYAEKIQSKKVLNDVNKLIKSIDNIYFERKINKINFNICKICNIVMLIQKNNSELYCEKCGNIKLLTGIVLDDSHYYMQEMGGRFKHGTYNPIRHCKQWLDNIQAKEIIEIKQSIIDKIADRIKRDKVINIENITYAEYRKYLKDLKITKYNNYIPLIRKHIAKVIPIQLTNNEELLIIAHFEICIKNYNDIKSKDKKNTIYYGFIIYKLIELLIDDVKKKQSLLKSIHLQEPSTLFENDKYWKKICNINKFKFISTDKNKY